MIIKTSYKSTQKVGAAFSLTADFASYSILATIAIMVIFSLACLVKPAPALADVLTQAQKTALQQELAQVEADQKQAASDLADAQAQSSSLSSSIAVLNAKIKTAQLNIKAKNLLIQSLGNDISDKQTHINNLEDNISKGKASLATILRKTSEMDDYSMPEVLLSDNSLSDFFQDVDAFQEVQDGLKSTFEQLRSDEASTSAEKDALTKRQNAELDAKHTIVVEQANIQADEDQKTQLLAVSKGNEKSYASLLAQKQARAAQIRAVLFPLAGGAKIPFGTALQYANVASQKTGVRAAFLLAILTQESALGANVGSCYLANSASGAGINVSSGASVAKVMNPTRDVPIFLQIVQALGYDPYKTVVSCPQSVGWGGAMGPAQFIASTWVLLQDRVASALGISGPVDPWNPQHAFMASGLYLADLGASGGSYSAERTAACKYFSGSVCSKSSLIASYGNSVVSKADTIQQTINQL